jgi:oligopeptide/dipeptide ABC transporter ATP-binding protein
MDVGGWLKGLGLGQYEALFRASDIDADILPELTDVDLKELGVPLGHRKRLLRAISGLAAAVIWAVPSASTGATPQDAAERRQLTVMFCDLIGSTPLSQRFDLEDLREIVGAYHRCVTDTVGRFGAKYMGDGVLINFGYPEAHEDDAERAARARLAVIDAVGRLATQETVEGADRHRQRSRRRWRPDRGPALRRSGASSARRQTSPPACRRWPDRARSLWPTAPGDSSARCSRSRISGPRSPSPMLRHDDRASLQGEIPSALSPPGGCPFHTRCHRKVGTSCETQNPVEQRLAQGSHRIVCHIPADELARLTAASERTAP